MNGDLPSVHSYITNMAVEIVKPNFAAAKRRMVYDLRPIAGYFAYDCGSCWAHASLWCQRLQVTFSPDGRWVLSASFDKSIKLWDGVKGTFVATFRNHVGPVFQASGSLEKHRSSKCLKLE